MPQPRIAVRDGHYDVAVLGTGSGNSVPGGPLAGKRIAIVEEGTFGGTCINVGCIPTKMFVYTAELVEGTHYASRLGVDASVNNVRWTDIRDRIFDRIDTITAGGQRYRQQGGDGSVLYQGHGEFAVDQPEPGQGFKITITSGVDEGETFTADQVILATGSKALIPAKVRDSGVPFHTSDTIMRIDAVPERLTIVGAGYIAAELGHVFGSLGSKITMVARSHNLLTALDDDLSIRFTKAATAKWTLHLKQMVTKFEGDEVEQRVTLEDGTVIAGDMTLVAIGRVANSDRLGLDNVGVKMADDGIIEVDEHQQTSVPGIWALGDVANGYQLKHVANHEERVVQHNVAHPDDPSKWVESNHDFVPAAVFTHPQLATVGWTEKQARAKGIDTVCNVQDYGSTAYGWAMEDTTSICKVVADRATGKLVGAQLIGPQASVLIQPLVQAMSFGIGAKEMARGQYWIHPALTEVVENALLGLDL